MLSRQGRAGCNRLESARARKNKSDIVIFAFFFSIFKFRHGNKNGRVPCGCLTKISNSEIDVFLCIYAFLKRALRIDCDRPHGFRVSKFEWESMFDGFGFITDFLAGCKFRFIDRENAVNLYESIVTEFAHFRRFYKTPVFKSDESVD